MTAQRPGLGSPACSSVGICLLCFSFCLTLCDSVRVLKDSSIGSAFFPCVARKVKYGSVCVCNQTYCDTIEPIGELEPGVAAIYATSMAGLRLQRSEVRVQTGSPTTGSEGAHSASADVTIDLNISETYQTIVGFGGAVTDAVALNLRKMDAALQDHFLNAYYGPGGAQYTLGRLTMASCDFSLHVYSYADVADDYALQHFSVAVDSDVNVTGNKLQFVHKIQNLTDPTRGFRWFASPWAAPWWMMAANRTSGNHRLKSDPRVHAAWALYFVKFLREYARLGVPIWAVTAQNEPAGNTGAWQDVKFSPEEQREFIALHLGPALRAGAGGVRLLMLDDQRALLPAWTGAVLGPGSSAAAFVDGIGVHWYTSLEDRIAWLVRPFEKMQQAHAAHPDKFILATEASNGYIPLVDQGPRIGDYSRAEYYAYDILKDLQSWAVGWTDWNLGLDLAGGPNWAHNEVDAPVLLDTQSGREMYKQPAFYYLAHFARFLPPGSRRVGSEQRRARRAAALGGGLDSVAFLTPARQVVVVVLNTMDVEQSCVVSWTESISGVGEGGTVGKIASREVTVQAKARSLITMVVPSANSGVRKQEREKTKRWPRMSDEVITLVE